MDQGHLREPGHDMPIKRAVMTVALLRAALVGLAIFSMPVERAFAEPVLRPAGYQSQCGQTKGHRLDGYEVEAAQTADVGNTEIPLGLVDLPKVPS